MDVYSRLKNTQSIIYDGHVIPGIWSSFSFLDVKLTNDKIAYIVVTNELEGRPDRIAHKVYGTPMLDWVLIAYNNISDINWPRSGDIVYYPIESVVIPEVVG